MIYEQPPERLASLADEYVLGTLALRARRRFERVLTQSAPARAAVREAEDRFLALDGARIPVSPAPETWERIRARLEFGHERGTASSATRWWSSRWSRGLVAAAVVGLALGIGWFVVERTGPATKPFASVTTPAGMELWSVEMDRSGSLLAVRAVADVPALPARSYELWALPESGVPVSLGLMPTTGEVRRELTAAQRVALAASAKVAVSLEPEGGSPTGAPTGPVLYLVEVSGA